MCHLLNQIYLYIQTEPTILKIYILYVAVYIELKVKTCKLCNCLVDGHKNGPKHVVVNIKNIQYACELCSWECMN